MDSVTLLECAARNGPAGGRGRRGCLAAGGQLRGLPGDPAGGGRDRDTGGRHLVPGAARAAAAGRDRRVLGAFAAYAAVALDQQRLAAQAEAAKPIAAADRMRTALLAAVSHDLRTPLASAKAAVTSLRSPTSHWGRVGPRSCSPPPMSPWTGSPTWWRTCWT